MSKGIADADVPVSRTPCDIGAAFETFNDVGEGAEVIVGDKRGGPTDCGEVAWPKIGGKWIVDFEINAVKQGKEGERKEVPDAERKRLYIISKSPAGFLRSE